ncbi:MAG: SGNH/GDSL hydrolase family protein [Labilithrix sp.]|nr:SGNH/GDSL hydrolase family protein [Labilithrix sp.]MCW5815713.1 SGNH/GDSL hydrolase family protein [Labilithrix sp.]
MVCSFVTLLAVANCGPQGSGDDDPASSSSGGVAAAPVTKHDINQVLSTGQSLSVGIDGGDAISTSQPYSNLMFKSGVIAGGAPPRELVPLVEGKATNPAHPNTETMSSGLANLVAKMAADRGERHDVLMSVHGVSHYVYAKLKKGTPPYQSGLAQAKAGHDAALAMGKDHVVRAVTVVHGESDDHDHNPDYQADIRHWQADYEADIRAVTGQSEPIPLLHSQLSSFVKTNLTSRIPIAQLAEHVESGGKTVLVGPKYQLSYAVDGVHLTNDGYRRMGEEYAKAYRKIVLEGQRWEPLRPSAVTRSGNVITVKFVVPVPPLVLDESAVKNPGAFGFEIAQDGPPAPAIQSVRVTGPDTVELTLASEPTGGNRRLRYAYTASALGVSAGPVTGPRGNLRDSDPTQSRTGGNPLWNWCVHFDEALP